MKRGKEGEKSHRKVIVSSLALREIKNEENNNKLAMVSQLIIYPKKDGIGGCCENWFTSLDNLTEWYSAYRILSIICRLIFYF